MAMKFDIEKFRKACEGIEEMDLACALRVLPSNVGFKELRDFLNICEYLDEDPNEFIIKE